MREYFFIIAGLILTVFGAVILTRRKIIVSRVIEQSFVMTIICLNLILGIVEEEVLALLWSIGIGVSVIIMMIFSMKGKYLIYNINQKTTILLLKQILIEKEISFEDRNTLMILKTYENKEIELHSSFFNVAGLDLHQIRDVQIHQDILDALKTRLNGTERKFFPWIGVCYVVTGLFCLWTVIN